jgi:ABC-type multidrug transport system ATPase subunit
MAKPDLEAGDKHRTPHNTQRIEIAFENLSYTVQAAPSADGSAAAGPPCCCRRGGLVDKHILSDISGVVSPGQFLAIIGASGSGKTTLLNTLANYTIPTSGRVLFNGQALKPRDRHAVAYVAQEDVSAPPHAPPPP